LSGEDIKIREGCSYAIITEVDVFGMTAWVCFLDGREEGRAQAISREFYKVEICCFRK